MSCTHASSCPSSLAFSVSSLSCPSSVVVERSATDIVSHDALDRFRLFSVALNRTNTPTRSSKHWHRHGLPPLPPPSATSSSQSNAREHRVQRCTAGSPRGIGISTKKWFSKKEETAGHRFWVPFGSCVVSFHAILGHCVLEKVEPILVSILPNFLLH
jgi:hypothetical protein